MYIGIDGEVNFSLIGTTAGVVSSIFVSLNGIFTSKVLPKVNDDKSLLLYYNNVNAIFLFLPLIVFFEKDVSDRYQNSCSLALITHIYYIYSSIYSYIDLFFRIHLHHLLLLRQVIMENSDKLTSLTFWFIMTITGAMGFCIGLATVMQVKATRYGK